MKEQGYVSPTEPQILNTITQLREIVEESKSSTKKHVDSHNADVNMRKVLVLQPLAGPRHTHISDT